MSARAVTVLAAGGTIAMAGESAVPALDAAALVAAVPALAAVPSLEARSLGAWPGVHVSGADSLAITRAAVAETRRGRGVVVTHGTDTLEESAFLCDLVHGGAEPIVFTGAIRPASAVGADGPANLVDAVAVAGGSAAAGLGVLVVFGGEVHAARSARKNDSTAPHAFASPGAGPLGHVSEGRLALTRRVDRTSPLGVQHMDSTVHAVSAGLGTDGTLVRAALGAGADGLVAVVLGAGHSPPAFLDAIRAAAARVPVVATVRPQRGAILRATYGFAGAEPDLRASGALCAGAVSPAAARIKLMACLGAGLDRAGIAAAFACDDR